MKFKKLFAPLIATVLASNFIGGTVNAIDYNAAGVYARKYVKDYNPAYADFNQFGGDCTNFASQILKAGGISELIHIDDYYDYIDPNSDYNKYHHYTLNCPCNDCWSYNSLEYRSQSWSDAENLADFLINELGVEHKTYWNSTKMLLEVEDGDIVFCSNSVIPSISLNTLNHTVYTMYSYDTTANSYDRYGKVTGTKKFHSTVFVGHSADKFYSYTINDGASEPVYNGNMAIADDYASYLVVKTSQYDDDDYWVDWSSGIVPKWYCFG